MEKLHHKPVDVLIVGAGPTGLMMACQLAIHEISFRIIEKNLMPSSNSGALIVQSRSLEIFEQMGIAEIAVGRGIIASKVNLVYDGVTISSLIIKDIGGDLSQFPFLLMLEQSRTEDLLIRFLGERSFYVERGIIFKSLVQDTDGVTSVVILPDAAEETIKSKYIVAADGPDSSVRNFLNIPFKGSTFPEPIFIVDCKADTDILPGEIFFAFSKYVVAGIFPLQGSRCRIDGTLPQKMNSLGNIAFENISKDFKVWTKMNISLQKHEWFSISHSHQKYAGSIRIENCFLAGDSAHVNTPIGAQGMNTGLQDAYNLAWKLAFVIKQKARPDLLDTYSEERSGITRKFAHYADAVFGIMTSHNPMIKCFRLHMLKVFLKVIFRLMKKRALLRKMFYKSISQIDIHYRKSALSCKKYEGNFLSGPMPGDRLPYSEFFYQGKNTDNYKIADVARFNLFVLANVIPDDLSETAEKYNLNILLISYLSETKKIYESMGIKDSGYFLIRPDMHVALRSATLNVTCLNNYLQTLLIVN